MVSLLDVLDKNILGLLQDVAVVAERCAVNVFIAGGFVRDLMLGVKDADIDIVVEGNAINFAKLLVDKFNVGAIHELPLLVMHEGFKTATIEKDGYRIDLATARKERYKKPAVLPEVKPATIKEDLFRRDFTINAMAISLNKDTFGELIDFYGGRKDLKDKKIRVLHDKSFIDDPTRIFRAIKFQERFAFNIEPRTQRLIEDAVELGMIEKLKKQRVKKEMDLILKEKNAQAIVSGLRQLKINV